MKSTPVTPCDPVAPYIGGKRNLALRIIRCIEAIPHKTYAEPFVGMGGVFLRRRFRPEGEIINDLNKDVANLFRILQCHYQAFLEMIRWQITTRAEFERLTATDPSTLTDLQRAARFLYLQRTAFGGRVARQNFGMVYDRVARFDLSRIEPMLEEVHSRLSRVVIECLDYKAFIEQYDRKETLFYLDPPYFGCEDDYGKELFSRAEFERMAEVLSRLKARFILSLNDTAEVRKTFSGFELQAVKTTYTLCAGANAKRVGELLISNIKLKGR